ncbi:DNA repair protein [Chryseobacterium shandongense]|uniref:DNA repair protein n=1 Tax=Chryseobacterium shandongense TaxID=1493872 RepID=A0AAD0YFG2_9FLAO|nr:JAB domain-containing protein [Chryseobacterium shandongense]AZA87553.1 DNA repair protein [Chryseobacterium shandongense]AZA96054.1 DNA repair protein [Chryseobacterium shandongense]
MKTNSKVPELLVSYSAHIVSEQEINNSRETYSLIFSHWNLDTIEIFEEVKILLLNKSNKVLGVYDLSKGGMSSSIIDVKIVLSIALKSLASGIIIVHNHPSGNLSPSKADIDITKKLQSACNLMDIKILDHLIISKDNYYSFTDDGLL